MMQLRRVPPAPQQFDSSIAAELTGTWLLAILLPGLVWQFASRQTHVPITNIVSLASGSIAVFLSVWISRNFARYPGIRGGSHVIGACFCGFAMTAAVLFVARLDYSILILVSAAGITTGWLVVRSIRYGRKQNIAIGIVPAASVQRLNDIPGVDWRWLSLDDEVGALTAVAADLHKAMPAEWERRLADYALSGMPVYHYKQLVEALTGRVELDHLSENSFGSLVPSIGYLKIKRLIDRVLAVVLLLLLLPLLAAVAVLVRLGSPGPAIFRQQRVGFRGVPFTIYKFRTMRVAGDPALDGEQDGLASSMTQQGDARITPLGGFLRRSRIDELPQLVNIVRGEMSLIGPRPEAEILSRWYDERLPFYSYRHIVPPGITGWAQINQGHVTAVADVRLKLDYDFFYVKHLSFWLDVVITVRTVVTMLSGRGAV